MRRIRNFQGLRRPFRDCGGSWSFRTYGGLPRIVVFWRPRAFSTDFFGKPELAAGGNCSGLDKMRVIVVPCLRWPASRYRCLAAAGLFDGTKLHGTPARRDIPRRPSNQTFVAVPKLKRKHISSTTVSTKYFLRLKTRGENGLQVGTQSTAPKNI